MSGSRKMLKVFKFGVLLFPFSLLLAVVPAAWQMRGRRSTKSVTQSGARPESNAAERKRMPTVLSSLPASFEPNRGQSDPSVKFLSRGPGYALFLTQGEAVLAFPGSAASDSASAKSRTVGSGQTAGALRLRILNANGSAKMEGESALGRKSNYFLGNRSSQQQIGVPNFAQVRYRAVYPGIDLVFHGDASRLEFDLDVAPGADVSAARFRLDGADKVRLDASGDVIATVHDSELRLRRPVSYLRTSNGERPVEGKFTLSASNEIGFEMGAYDASLPLVIDPVLAYSTFLGGSGADQVFGVAVDPQGNFYVVGQTASSNLPVKGAFQGTSGGFTDAFVAKFNADGSGLVYCTYLGGSLIDIGQGIAVDSTGSAYVTGFTTSTNFPTKNALQATLKGQQDIFVTKLSPDGASLVFSTYLGGSALDTIAAIALDAQNNVVLAGTTKSTDFPTVNELEGSLHGAAGNSDAFVSKISADGSHLIFSTYLGGASVEGATGVAVDSQGDILVSGGTDSTDFPVQNAIQGTAGGGPTSNAITSDAFLTKLAGDGSAILFSTYWGGTGSEQATSVSVDASNNIILAGETTSTDFPTLNPLEGIPANGGAQITGFVTKFKSDGSAMLFSTYFGGTGSETIFGSAVDLNGNIYVSGNTTSTDLPVTGAIQSTYGGGASDGFVSEISANGSALIFSTYLGGAGTDAFNRVAADSHGAYLVGSTSAADFPTAGTQASAFAGSTDGVVVKIATVNASAVLLSTESLTFNAQNVGTTSTSQPVTMTNTGNISLTIASIVASSDYGETNTCGAAVAAGASCTINVTFKPTASGTRTGTVTITDNASTSPQTVSLTGMGAAVAPVGGVSPGSLTFAAQVVGVSSASQPVTLSNTGTAALTISSIAASGDFSQTNNCGNSVAASASCTVNVTFKPTVSGTRTGTLTITDNASTSPQTVNLTGSGTASSPVAGVSPSSLTFSSQLAGTPSASQPVTLSNTGTGALTISSVVASGDFSQTNNCGNSVAASASCTINVVFTPTSSGKRTGTVTITDNASNSPQSVSLTGNGADFTITPASGAATTATVARGQTASYSLSLAPTGGLSGNISFACSGAPAASTCSVTPPSRPTDGSSATNVNVSVTTTAASSSAALLQLLALGEHGTPSHAWKARMVLFLALILVAIVIPMTRRPSLISAKTYQGVAWRLPRFVNVAAAVLLIAVLAATLTTAGCAGGYQKPVGNAGTPVGTYSLVVTATFTAGTASVKHNVTLTLTVQ